MRVTLQDVAQAAGVSPATVSRVLSGREPKLFVPSTRQRILKAAEKLGYRPSLAARALATGRTSLVTLWTYQPYKAFFASVIEKLLQQAHEHGYGLLVADVAIGSMDKPPASSCIWPSDGILAMNCGPWAERLLHARPSERTPIVSMGTTLVPGTDTVQLDLSSAFRQATEHLVAEGCRRIVYLSVRAEDDDSVLEHCSRAPRLAYQAVMENAGLTEEYIQLDTDTHAASRQSVVGYVKKHGCPDGILCRNDEMAIGAYRAICDLGLHVGRDVLLIGCDGIEETQFFECPLSTITLPVPRMCELAWQLLDRRMADPSAPLQHVVLDATVVLRASARRSPRPKKVRKR